ncbi:MAG: hypothetical protein J5950_05530 [Clostridia bacterium]|nr:hypothetical protein [Clostridia bacterium]
MTLAEAAGSGRAGHAYVFCGPDGIGRRSFAKEFARAVMCTGAEGGAVPCGNCPSCRLLASGTNPDLKLIRGDESRATVGVETVRQLEEDIATAPTVSARKVYIIERSEKLTVQAQNALLKTIEEPPSYVMLILICSNPSLLIDTVRSRVTRLDFARYSNEEVLKAYRDAAEEGAPELSAEDGELVTSYADGIIGRGLQFRDFGFYGALRERIFDTLLLLKEGRSAFFAGFTELFTSKDNAADREYMFFELTSAVRDAMVYARTNDAGTLQNRQFRDKIEELAEIAGRHGWEKALDAVSGAYQLTGQNVNYRMIIVNLAAQIIDAVQGDSGRLK